MLQIETVDEQFGVEWIKEMLGEGDTDLRTPSS